VTSSRLSATGSPLDEGLILNIETCGENGSILDFFTYSKVTNKKNIKGVKKITTLADYRDTILPCLWFSP
jgi:hypothetical protein